MSSDPGTHGSSSDEAAEIARLIEQLQSASKPSVTARAAQQTTVEPAAWSRGTAPPNPWQPVTSSASIETRPTLVSRAFERIAKLQIGRGISGPMGPGAVWACVTLGVLLSVSMIFWPYSRCGAGLFCYLGAVGMVHVAGVWAAWHAWDSRVGIAHVMALVIVLWGVSLTAKEILPRVGYAKATASWDCSTATSSQG